MTSQPQPGAERRRTGRPRGLRHPRPRSAFDPAASAHVHRPRPHLGNITAVLVLYYLLPLDHPVGWGTALALLGGLVCVAVLTAWQVRSVLRSPHPGLQAAETLALTVSLFLVLFAACYQQLAATPTPPPSPSR